MILDYCPSMIYDTLESVMENLVMIDVNVTREQIELSEDIDEDSVHEDDRFDDDTMKLSLAETLDVCMEKFFGFLQKISKLAK